MVKGKGIEPPLNGISAKEFAVTFNLLQFPILQISFLTFWD